MFGNSIHFMQQRRSNKKQSKQHHKIISSKLFHGVERLNFHLKCIANEIKEWRKKKKRNRINELSNLRCVTISRERNNYFKILCERERSRRVRSNSNRLLAVQRMLKSGNLLHSLDAMLNLYVLLHLTRSPVLMREWYFMVDERRSLKQTESQSNEETQREWS